MDTSWFELRVDYEKVAAFSYGDSGQTYDEAKEKTFALLDVTCLDLYKGRVMQVVDVWQVQTINEKGEPSFTLNGLQEKIIHEEHPTVLEVDAPNSEQPITHALGPLERNALSYDLKVS
jgi:hypothetical protein